MNDKEVLDFVIRFRNEADAAIKAADKDVRRLADAGNKQALAAKRQKEAQDKLAGAFGKTAIAAASLYASFKAFDKAIDTFAAFDEGMIGVAKTTGLAGAELDQIRKTIKDTARDIPVSTGELLELGQAAGQLGVTGVSNVSKFSITVAKLGVAGNLAGEEAATALARMLNVAGEAVGDVDKVASAITALGNTAAASEREIGNFATQMTQALSRFGAGTQDAVAMGAAMADLGLRAETSATAVAKVFGEIEQAGFGSRKQLDALVQLTGLQSDEFQRLARETPTEAFDVFLQGMKRAIESGENYTPILEELGLNNAEVLKTITPLAQGLDKLNALQKVAAKEYERPLALTKEAEAAYASYNNQVQLTVNGLTQLQGSIGEVAAKGMVPFLEDIRNITNSVIEWNEANDGAFAKLVVIGGQVATFVIGLSLLASAFNLMKVAAVSAWAAAGGPVTIIAVGVAAVVYAVTQAYQQFELVRNAVDGVVNSLRNLIGLGPDELAEETLKAREATQAYKDAVNALVQARGEEIEVSKRAEAQQRQEIINRYENANAALAEASAIIKAYEARTTSGQRRRGRGDSSGEAKAAFEQAREAQAIIDELQEGYNLILAQDFMQTETYTTMKEGLTNLLNEWKGVEEVKEAVTEVQAAPPPPNPAIAEMTRELTEQLRILEQEGTLIGLNGEELEREKLTIETINKAREDGFTVSERQLNIVRQIANETQRQADAQAAGGKAREVGGAKSEFDLEAKALQSAFEAGSITGNQLAAGLSNSDYSEAYRQFISEFGIEGATEAALSQARAQYDSLNAQLDQYLADGTIKIEDAERVRADIQNTYRVEELAAKGLHKQALKDLDASIGFKTGEETDENNQFQLQIDAETAHFENRMQLLEQNEELFIGRKAEYDRRKEALAKQHAANLEKIEDAKFKVAVNSVASIGDSTVAILKQTAGEQSGIYKAAFLAQKAYGIASSVVAIASGIAKAADNPYPYNLVAMASVAASTVGLVAQISSAKLALANGGIADRENLNGMVFGAGGPRDDKIPAMLSNGEFVVNAEATRQNRTLLEAINSGAAFASGGNVGSRGSFASPEAYGGSGGGMVVNNYISVERGGGEGSGESEDNDSQFTQELADRIAEATRAVIREEKRAGGELADIGA